MIAYLDPASGSMILSVVAGGIAGIAVFVKSFGHRIWSAIAFWKKDDADAAPASEAADASETATASEAADGSEAAPASEPVETSS